MQEKKISINIFYNILNQIVSFIVPLILSPYVARVLSAELIGDYSYVNYNSIIHCCHIGKFCSIGPNVVAGLGNHPVEKNVTTSPRLFLKGKFLLEDRYDQFAIVTIGNDVWIGANVTIVNGVTIGDGAVIGANSIVTKDIPPY